MNQNTINLLFILLRSAVCGTELQESEKALYSDGILPQLFALSNKHDVAHLVGAALNENGLLKKGEPYSDRFLKKIMTAVYHYEQLNFELKRLCDTLEEAKIPFIPLKGSVMRKYYREPWMRNSCDIDVLVRYEDLERAISALTEKLQYIEKERATYDVPLFSPADEHIELHFDLVEEGRAKSASEVLSSVWDNVYLHENCSYRYEMTDEFFYFYHIAHMAKHFETGGCGIRPFIDLWILDNLENVNVQKRQALLKKGGLEKFAEASQNLSKAWFCGEAADEVINQMQNFILSGGMFGSSQNRVALQQTKKGGRVGYLFSRIFIPYDRLRRYYPILKKHRWLMPFMQIRRWFWLLFRSDVASIAKNELKANMNIEKSTANEMNEFLNNVGL